MLEPWNDLSDQEVARATAEGLRLLGVRCAACGRIDFPAVPFCRSCLGEDVEPEAITPEGVLYAFTTIRTASDPYTVGYVDLDGGLRAFGRIDGPATIGARMTLRDEQLPITFTATAGGGSNG